MTDIKLSQLPIAPTANYQTATFYMVLNGTSYQISFDKLMGITRYSAQTTSFTIKKPAYSKLVCIDCRANSGSGSFKVGTTAGGSEILPLTSVTTTDMSLNDMLRNDAGEVTLYFTVVSGILNFKVQILNSDL